MYELPEKVIKKSNEELIDIHKKCITNYLIQRQIKITRRRQLFIIYDHYISHKNSPPMLSLGGYWTAIPCLENSPA